MAMAFKTASTSKHDISQNRQSTSQGEEVRLTLHQLPPLPTSAP